MPSLQVLTSTPQLSSQGLHRSLIRDVVASSFVLPCLSETVFLPLVRSEPHASLHRQCAPGSVLQLLFSGLFMPFDPPKIRPQLRQSSPNFFTANQFLTLCQCVHLTHGAE